MAAYFHNLGPPKPRRTQDKHQPLYGRDAIAEYVGRHKNTISRWIANDGFPAATMPNGQYITTPGLIESWILSKAVQQAENKTFKAKR